MSDEIQGGSGGGRDRRYDGVRLTRLHERAIRQRWPIPQEQRAKIVERLMQIVQDPHASAREVTSASRALIAAERQNMEQECIDDKIPNRLEISGPDGGPIPVGVQREQELNRMFQELETLRRGLQADH